MTTSFRKTAIKLAGILAIGLFGIVLILYFKLAVTFLSFFESMETDSPESKSAFVLKRHENQVITDVRQLLFQQFSDLLREPEAYRKLIRQECHIFPEGELFGYVLPLFSYAHITLENPRLRDFALSKSADLISLAIPEVERQVSPPGGRLENLRDFNDQATYLGQFNMALGYYRMLGGDGRFDKIHKAVSEALFRALLKNNAFPLNSYPEHSWTFDTVPCLVSLRLCDKATGSKRYESVIKEHLKWMREKGTEPETGLPYSAVSESGKQKIVVAPRGCDISWRIALLNLLDADYSRSLYRNYTAHFWREQFFLSGFSEWSEYAEGEADIDSGPIITDVGLAATSLGIGTVLLMDDTERLTRITEQFGNVDMIKSMAGYAKDFDPVADLIQGDKYYTGFLFGDICLFYAISWNKAVLDEFGDKNTTMK